MPALSVDAGVGVMLTPPMVKVFIATLWSKPVMLALIIVFDFMVELTRVTLGAVMVKVADAVLVPSERVTVWAPSM